MKIYKDYILRKIKIEEIDKLQDLFPGNNELWLKYREKRMKELENLESEIFVAEYNNDFIGEITVNYTNHNLTTETIPNKRVYFEAFRIKKTFQGKRLGQALFKYVLKHLEENGYIEFTIGVEADNLIAKHIYNKLGFTEIIDKGYGDEFDSSDYDLYLRRKEL